MRMGRCGAAALLLVFTSAGASAQQNVVAVDAGPIWSDADAQTKCPNVARTRGGIWTGHWWTTVQGRMSVCAIQLSSAAPAPGRISGVGCTQTGAPISCLSVTPDAGGQSYILEANPKPDAGRRISYSGTQRQGGGGGSICTGAKLENVTWSYVNTGPACPPANPF